MNKPHDGAADRWRSTIFLPETDFPMRAGLAASEPRRLAAWAEADAHHALRRLRAGAPRYLLHDGPPYANGDMHLGHALNHIAKDLVIRGRSMKGMDAPYVPGWDCHGLPIEWRVEEENRAAGRDKGSIALADFRRQCRDYAAHWVNVQRAQLKRLGIWGDWEKPYLTMDFEAEATIARELMAFARSGQVYRGARPVMWSPVEQTALAEAEVEYHDIVSTQIDVGFELVAAPAQPELVGAHALIWTTTPWTIPANRAIAWSADVAYGLWVDGADRRLVLADALAEAVGQRLGQTLRRLGGARLDGAVARHPWHARAAFFAEPRPLLAADFVTTDQGTGLVHMAPDHGEDDFRLCQDHGLEPMFLVGPDGRYRDDWPVVGGGHVFQVNAPDGPVAQALAAEGALWAARADYAHSYPHSWRSKAKLIHRCTPQWFIAMDRPLADGRTLRQRALAAISQTRWFPPQGENRIRAMVEGRPDWVISRQRAWGVPIPLFVHRASGEILVDEAVNARILEAFRRLGADSWWTEAPEHFLEPEYRAADWSRVDDILDVWFDSGSTFAFVTEARLGAEQADLYLEGSDQHRGWFQSSLLVGAGTRGRAPYRAVFTHGFTLDAEGRKMSKSLGNVIDPNAIVAEHGADVLRLWVASTDVTQDQRLGPQALRTASDSYRRLRNSLRYLLGACAGWGDEEALDVAHWPLLERWLASRLRAVDRTLDAALERHDWAGYTAALVGFSAHELSTLWFDIRKDSLYCDAPSDPRRRAVRTLMRFVLDWLTRRLAPILVFTAEEAWEHRPGHDGSSVHHQRFAEVPDAWSDPALEARFERLWSLRSSLHELLEPMRRGGEIRTFLGASVRAGLPPAIAEALEGLDPAELFLIASLDSHAAAELALEAGPSPDPRCPRCWRHLPAFDADGLCQRCHHVVDAA